MAEEHKEEPASDEEMEDADAEALPFAPVPEVRQALRWIGFTENPSQAIENDLGSSFHEIAALGKEDVKMSQKTFANLTIATGRLVFGTRRTKYLLDMIDWTQDFKRVGKEPTIDGLDQESFLEALRVARERAVIRASRKDSLESQGKEASPGKLTGVKTWSVWILKLFNYLSMVIGTIGVPLLYVVRESVEDLLTTDGKETDSGIDWERQCILHCPHKGRAFEEDSRRVHQMVLSFCIGEQAEAWLKTTKRLECGKRDVATLCDHYRGAANKSRQISEGVRLRETLHYRSENACLLYTSPSPRD